MSTIISIFILIAVVAISLAINYFLIRAATNTQKRTINSDIQTSLAIEMARQNGLPDIKIVEIFERSLNNNMENIWSERLDVTFELPGGNLDQIKETLYNLQQNVEIRGLAFNEDILRFKNVSLPLQRFTIIKGYQPDRFIVQFMVQKGLNPNDYKPALTNIIQIIKRAE